VSFKLVLQESGVFTLKGEAKQGPAGPPGTGGPGGGSLTVRDADGNPNAVVSTLVFPANTVGIVDGVATITGLQGPAGATGPQGPIGNAGPAGPTGPQGIQGVPGATGPAGAQGIQGATGNTGPQGPQGPTGLTGPAGPQGATGATGPQGPQGPQGPPGSGTGGGELIVRELDGTPDAPVSELVFPNGTVEIVDGVATITGLQGPQGPAGATGPQGATGAQGATGPQGNAGPAGATGAQGPQGPTGSTGATGAAGSNGTNGVNADMTRTSTSPNAIALGPSTFAYAASANLGWTIGMRLRAANSGTNYEEGVITAVSTTSVTINVDLAVGAGTFSAWAIGVAGDRGATGPTGATGATGAQGIQGIQGPAGPQGPAGTGSGGGAAPQLTLVGLANTWYSRRGSGPSAGAIVANRRYVHMFYHPGGTINEITVTVTIAAAALTVIRMGIRNCNQTTGQPTTLIIDAGTVDCSTTGQRTIQNLNVTVAAGWYLLEMTSNGAPSVTSMTAPDNSFGTEITNAGINVIATLFRDFAYGSLAPDETANTWARTGTHVVMGVR
jgi:hypothetical protein